MFMTVWKRIVVKTLIAIAATYCAAPCSAQESSKHEFQRYAQIEVLDAPAPPPGHVYTSEAIDLAQYEELESLGVPPFENELRHETGVYTSPLGNLPLSDTVLNPSAVPPSNLHHRSRPWPFWVRAEYLLWNTSGLTTPPLITTSQVGTSRADAGVLGLSSTGVLLGNGSISDDTNSGLRIELGTWFESSPGLGAHFAYYSLGDGETSKGFANNGTAILARPFFSIEPSSTGPNSELITFPNELEGNINVSTSTEFDGAEVFAHYVLDQCSTRRIQLLGGYQYNSLNDDLSISDFRRVVGPSSGLAIGTTLAEQDRFETKNQFQGLAVGILLSTRQQSLTMDLGMQLGLGNNRTTTRIGGSTTSTVPRVGGGSDVSTTAGGLLAQTSNSGVFSDDEFAMIPQLNAGLGYDLHPNVRAVIGYRFLYWSQVARAGEQIDTGVNLSQLDPGGPTGELRPRFEQKMTDFIAQGLNVGLDFRF